MQGYGPITDVNTIGERLKWARAQRGLTQAQLAKRVGVSQGSVANAEAGTRGRPRDLLGLAQALNASPNWLETGHGEWQADSPNVSFLKPAGKVPLISWAAAEAWVDVQNRLQPVEADQWVDVFDTQPGEDAFALLVSGDSMTSPLAGSHSFPNGTIIVVDPARGWSAGDFVVAKDAQTEKATFKCLAYDGGRWFLKPLNPVYPIVEIDDPSYRVIGRVTEFILRGKV